MMMIIIKDCFLTISQYEKRVNEKNERNLSNRGVFKWLMI